LSPQALKRKKLKNIVDFTTITEIFDLRIIKLVDITYLQKATG
jgi:hypothetical protein